MKQASADGSDSKEALNNLLGRKDDSYKDTVQSEDKEVKDLSQKVKDDDEQENNEEGEEDVMPVLMKGNHRVKH
jgi:hypothetical protein